MKSRKTVSAVQLLWAAAMSAMSEGMRAFNTAQTTAPNDYVQVPGDEIRIAQAAVKIWRGTAVGQVTGTGYATPLVAATAGMKFIGMAEETSDNTSGTPGTFTYNAPLTGYSPFIRLARDGEFCIDDNALHQTGTAITQAHIGLKVYWTDNQTVSLTANQTFAGVLTRLDESGNPWFDISSAVMPLPQDGWVALAGATDAIPPNTSANYIVTYAGVDAMTLAAPTAVIDDGKTITVSSGGAHAHTITATGLLKTGTASVNVATFAAYAGAGVTLRAYNGLWQVISAVGITFS